MLIKKTKEEQSLELCECSIDHKTFTQMDDMNRAVKIECSQCAKEIIIRTHKPADLDE